MKRILSPIIVLAMATSLTGCQSAPVEPKANPLLEAYETPFQLPPFERITLNDYAPALRAGMDAQNRAIEGILADSSSTPTLENTLLPFAYSGQLLNRVSTVFYNLNAADTNPEMQKLAEEFAPQMAEHSDNIYLNRALYDRLSGIDTTSLDWEQKRLLSVNLQRFKRAGVALDSVAQGRLREINQKLSLLELKFGDNVLAETNNFHIKLDSSQLSGLPKNVVADGKLAAEKRQMPNAYVFTPHKPSMLPFLTYSTDAKLRKELYSLYYLRADRSNANDNKQNITQIVNLRLERAKLLGYESHAAYVLSDAMAKTVENVHELLDTLWPAALAKAKAERRKLEDMMHSSGQEGTMDAADWWHYAEKVRLAEYDLDEEMIRPYLSVDTVREGIFDLSNRLYGLTFKRLENVPVYHEEVEAYEVLDKDDTHLAVIYFDFFPRDGKGAGAWCTTYQRHHITQDGEERFPIVSIVCNFSRPTPDAPALLLFDEAETLFHEFGHALHSFFSVVKYPATGSVPRDFVEMPSQVMEHWASEPEFLRHYAHHYKTGKPMPEELIAKIKKSSKFNQGFNTVEYMAAAILDLRYHQLVEPLTENVDVFEKNAMDSIGLIPEILPRYRSTYFSHIFDGGYSSGYYSYIWSEALDCDVYSAFTETGDIFNREVANAFRTKVLQWGNMKDSELMFREFRGRDVDIKPLLKQRDLKIEK